MRILFYLFKTKNSITKNGIDEGEQSIISAS